MKAPRQTSLRLRLKPKYAISYNYVDKTWYVRTYAHWDGVIYASGFDSVTEAQAWIDSQ